MKEAFTFEKEINQMLNSFMATITEITSKKLKYTPILQFTQYF